MDDLLEKIKVFLDSPLGGIVAGIGLVVVVCCVVAVLGIEVLA